MPSKSKAQAKLMAAAAHNPAFAKKVGIDQETAKEWSGHDSKDRTKKLPEKVAKKHKKPETAKDKKSSNETYTTTATLAGPKGFRDQ